MRSNDTPASEGGAAAVVRLQARTSGLMVLSILLCILGIDQLAHAESISEWVCEQRREQWQRNGSVYWDRQLFIDPASRTLLQDIPEADYSRGGVVLIGSSSLHSALMGWKLPAEQHNRIWNYAVGGATLTDQANLLHYLVEERGLLAAGGEKTLVVLGLFYGDAVRGDEWKFGGIFVNVCKRYGLFEYARDSGVRPATHSAIERVLRTELAICSNFIETLCTSLRLGPGLRVGVRPEFPAASPRDRRRYARIWSEWMGPDWEPAMQSELQALADLIDYLQARDARVSATLLPLGSWHFDQPYAHAFEQRVLSVCESRSVSVTNLSGFLDDSEFADIAHPNFAGSSRLHPRFARPAREHLVRASILE